MGNVQLYFTGIKPGAEGAETEARDGGGAGRLALQAVQEAFEQPPEKAGARPIVRARGALAASLEHANQVLFSRGAASGAGSPTARVLAARFLERHVVVARVGGFALGVARSGHLTQLEPKADFRPEELVGAGALGVLPRVRVELSVYEAEPFDVLIFCQTQVWSRVSQLRLWAILRESDACDLRVVGRWLLEHARQRGAIGNLMVGLARATPAQQILGPPEQEPWSWPAAESAVQAQSLVK